MPEPVLELRDVHVEYNTDDGIVHAVRGASYGVYPDQTLALVGESGCGKSQSAYAAMGLIQPPGRVTRGRILFQPNGAPSTASERSWTKCSACTRTSTGGTGSTGPATC